MSDEEDLTLGERLLAGVRNLWQQVNRQGKVLDHHGHEIEAMKGDLADLRRQVQGLKISRGKALASNGRLRKTIADAEKGLQDIDAALH